jgi:hypothetical protein
MAVQNILPPKSQHFDKQYPNPTGRGAALLGEGGAPQLQEGFRGMPWSASRARATKALYKPKSHTGFRVPGPSHALKRTGRGASETPHSREHPNSSPTSAPRFPGARGPVRWEALVLAVTRGGRTLGSAGGRGGRGPGAPPREMGAREAPTPNLGLHPPGDLSSRAQVPERARPWQEDDGGR